MSSSKPQNRVRMEELRVCLRAVFARARELDAAVAMPKIGAGLGGGNWKEIRELIGDL